MLTRRGAIAVLREEARPPRHVHAVLFHRAHQRGDLRRVVLPVGVDLYSEVVAVLVRIPVARLHRAPDAEVEGMHEHVSPGRAGLCRRAVGGAVIDDHDLEAGLLHADRVHDRADVPLLVVCGDYRECLHLITGLSGAWGQETCMARFW